MKCKYQISCENMKQLETAAFGNFQHGKNFFNESVAKCAKTPKKGFEYARNIGVNGVQP